MKKIIDEFSHLPSGFQRWKKRNPEAARESERNRKNRIIEKDPLRYMLKNVKSRAKKDGIEFSITKNDLEWPTHCPVLGMPLIRNSKKGWADDTYSLDRVDNTKGYIPGNVKIISWRANGLKKDASIEELEKILVYMKTHLKENKNCAGKAD